MMMNEKTFMTAKTVIRRGWRELKIDSM